ncbi:MAG: response regulator [Myxococcaceae bacterium]|nr:response regulator [Myxococcaceae bacterium]
MSAPTARLLDALRDETMPRMAATQGALHAARKGNTAAPLKEVRELVHKVAGTAALAGLPNLSKLCRLGEGIAVLALDGDAKPSPRLFDLLELVLMSIEEALSPATATTQPNPAFTPPPATPMPHSPEGRVVVGSDEGMSGKLLVRLLEEAGFAARRCSLDDAADALPDCELLLLDVGAQVPAPKLEDALANGRKRRLPVVIIAKGDVSALAPRASAVLQKPVSTETLIATLRTEVQRRLQVAAARAKAPTSTAPGYVPVGPQLKVLVVDDSRVIRGVVREALAEVGVVTIEAADGAEALQQYEQTQPDAVISDLQMPGVDGARLIPMLREKSAGKKVPIIVLSAMEDDVSRNAALSAGADAYLVKSIIDGPQLLRALKNAGLPLPSQP